MRLIQAGPLEPLTSAQRDWLEKVAITRRAFRLQQALREEAERRALEAVSRVGRVRYGTYLRRAS